MGKKGTRMDRIREIIRLKSELDLGCRKIAEALNILKNSGKLLCHRV